MMGRSVLLQENPINPYIWCAVGGIVGYLAGLMFASGTGTAAIENVLVGVFGAFLGGDLLVSQLNGGVVNDKDFQFSSLGYAIAGAVLLVSILKIMRKSVGQIKPSKSKNRNG
jgi:uncharacterized membrane protein YeaQ/YmgE (transglycosylase-associated protein family)